MNICKDKVILIIGGQNLINAAFVQHILDGAAREVRILGSSETAAQSHREELPPLKAASSLTHEYGSSEAKS